MSQNPELFRVDPGAALRSLALALRDEFDGVFSLEAVERYLRETFAALEQRASVNRFLPLLAERRARDELAVLATWRDVPDLPSVLFVSAADAGRSVMAQALLRDRAGDGVLAWACGGGTSADLASRALSELGVERLGPPLPYDDELVRLADVVVTLGGEACPLVEHHRYEDWTPGSRVDRTLDEARRSRDLIAEQVDRLVAALHLAGAA